MLISQFEIPICPKSKSTNLFKAKPKFYLSSEFLSLSRKTFFALDFQMVLLIENICSLIYSELLLSLTQIAELLPCTRQHTRDIKVNKTKNAHRLLQETYHNIII